MAKKIDSQLIFLTTSPRTPEKMIPEIDLLIRHFEGRKWNEKTQCEFMKILREEQFFNGQGANNPDFSARDRINRAPKSLGFVTLSPSISLTPAGEALLRSKRKEEVFLRQMLKFQVPSPFHNLSDKAANFCVKPYLEMLRLVRTMGTLRFDELQIFGMQLTDWHDFDKIVKKIESFRLAKMENTGNYRKFKVSFLYKELQDIYKERIQHGKTKTRESKDNSIANFLKTQSNNMRDYADACFRYLRATGLVQISYVGKSLSIIPDRIADVDYILSTVDRNPCFVDNEDLYKAYLGDATMPRLLTDSRERLIECLTMEFPAYKISQEATIQELKDAFADLSEMRKDEKLQQQMKEIKNHKLYDEIQNTYRQIAKNELYDAPLMLEWNTWRAMVMLDGGNIKANLKFDDFGNPLSTAAGNMADIVCDYEDYLVCVEVTMASGQRQYDMEGEPISRHLGKIKKTSGKPCYCLFLAPTINDACVAHFYALHQMNISYYGGKSVIVPLPINVFQKMLEDSYKSAYIPKPSHVRNFFEKSLEIVKTSDNEMEWFEKMQQYAKSWLL